MIVKKIQASLGFVKKLMMMANVNCKGTRIAIRIHIWYDCCTFVISVVRRVTSEDVENLSTLEKENFCTL